MVSKHATGTRRHSGDRRLRIEGLEEKIALSATPPTVVDVTVAGTDWSTDFLQYLDDNNLGDGGYSIPVGSAAQETTLPWNNINQIRITFSEDVHVDAADLAVSGVNTPSHDFAHFDYRPEDRLAVWTLDEPLTGERYWLDLDADGIDPVTNLDGELLDGEWTNATDTFPSGNGVAGGDFEFGFNVLPGDVLGINYVEYNNYMFVYLSQGQDTTTSGYVPRYDIDGSGAIDAADAQAVWDDLWNSLPVGTPVGALDDAPTTQGIDYVEIQDAEVDVAISLYDAFDDAEDADNELVYAIEDVSSPELFDAVFIDPATGELILNAADSGASSATAGGGATSAIASAPFSRATPSGSSVGGTAAASAGVSGTSTITVSATDSTGQKTSTTFIVDVNRQNIVPTLVVNVNVGIGGVWLIDGYVIDADELDFDSLIVILDGVLDNRLSVAEDGTFFLSTLIDPLQAGTVYAWVNDNTWATSPVVQFQVGY